MKKQNGTTKKDDKNISLRVTDTTLRDSHQSLWATRLRTEDIMKIIDVIDSVGYYSLECWGGATFDVCLRFLRESPWERLRLIKSKARKTPLQMLLRGQNLVGYKNYADDLVERFVAKACSTGIDIFRVFDALNDTRNLETAIKAVKKCKAHAQGTLSYTISPVHTTEKYVRYAREQVELGIDSLCIKDMAGILSPVKADELVRALKAEIKIPIQLHTHSTSGMATSAYIFGVFAGAGAIDCAIASMAGFSSQPPVETMYAIFRETDYALNLDIDALRRINRFFYKLAPHRAKVNEQKSAIDAEILFHQIPGGMISNFTSQLEQQQALDKLPQVLEEVVRVREDLGFPPLVTPTSQIVGTQAVLNVISGERYKIVPNEVKDYLRGLYGRSPAPVNEKIFKKILGNEKPINHRPADDLPPLLPNAGKDVNPKWIENEEDLLSYLLFPEQAIEFFKWRLTPPDERPEIPAEIELNNSRDDSLGLSALNSPQATNLYEINEPLLVLEDYQGVAQILEKASGMKITEMVLKKGDFSLTIRGGDGPPPPETAIASQSSPGKTAAPATQSPEKIPAPTKGTPATAAAAPTAVAPANTQSINSMMVGTFYRAAKPSAPPIVEEGAVVNAGSPVCIVEAMKLFNEITAPKRCKIIKFLIADGQKVEKGQPLITIEDVP